MLLSYIYIWYLIKSLKLKPIKKFNTIKQVASNINLPQHVLRFWENKFKQLKEQHPEVDLRLVFSNPKTKIGKKSKTTYGMWCERIGYPYAKETIPVEWLKENGKKTNWLYSNSL